MEPDSAAARSSPASAAPPDDTRLARALAFIAPRRFGTLVTAGTGRDPSAVPCVYAVLDGRTAGAASGPVIAVALDEKPKRVGVRDLARVRNVMARPRATLLVSDDDEDWGRLAWAQLHADAAIAEPGADQHAAAVAALRAKYPQYAGHDLEHRPQIHLHLHPHPHAASIWAADDTRDPARPADLGGILRGRRSVRSFRPDPVPAAAIRRAVAAAGWAPSPHGTQPWRFVVLESRERRVALADAMADTWRAQLALDDHDPDRIEQRVANSRDRLVTPPVLILMCRYLGDAHPYPDADRRDAETTMATQSLGAAAQNLLLSLYADGLDAGWMCAPLFCPDLIVAELGLDLALEPHAFFPVGYAARNPKRRPRRDPDELIVRWE